MAMAIQLHSRGVLCACVFVLMAISLEGAPVPTRNLRSLVESADVVVSGVVIGTSAQGTVLIGAPHNTTATVVVAELMIDQIVKGTPAAEALGNGGRSLFFRFARPTTLSEPRLPQTQQSPGLTRYANVELGVPRMFFLKRTAGVYEVVSPLYPSVVTVPDVRATSATPFDRVVEAIAGVVSSSTASPETKREAIQALYGIQSDLVRATLTDALREIDDRVRLSAAAVLLSTGEMAALPVAEAELLSPRFASDSELVQNLRVGLRDGIKDPQAIPALGRLLRGSSDPDTRRAVSFALKEMKAMAAVPVLLSALDDSDLLVRYHAVMGLAAATNQTRGSPSLAAFRSDEQKYLQQWRGWAQRR